MLVQLGLCQLGLCQTCSDTTLLAVPRGGSYFGFNAEDSICANCSLISNLKTSAYYVRGTFTNCAVLRLKIIVDVTVSVF